MMIAMIGVGEKKSQNFCLLIWLALVYGQYDQLKIGVLIESLVGIIKASRVGLESKLVGFTGLILCMPVWICCSGLSWMLARTHTRAHTHFCCNAKSLIIFKGLPQDDGSLQTVANMPYSINDFHKLELSVADGEFFNFRTNFAPYQQQERKIIPHISINKNYHAPR